MERGGKSTEATRVAQAQGHVHIRPERGIRRAQEHHPPHRAGQARVHLYHTKTGESARGRARRSGRTRARRGLSMQRFTAIYEDGENGWIVATCPEVPGAITQGRTHEEARENLKDAIHMMLEARREDAEKDLQGKDVTREYIEV